MNEVLFVYCTEKQYNDLVRPDSNTLYFVTNGDETDGFAIYKGDLLMANNVQMASGGVAGSVLLTDDIQTNSEQGVNSGMAVTPKAVFDFFKNIDAMRFKGTIGTGGTIATVPTNGYNAGDVYKIITAGTYVGQTCEVGDMLIAIKDGPSSGSTVINADWVVVQGNIDGVVIGPSSATNLHVAVFDGSTGKIIKDGGHDLSEFLTTHQNVQSDGVLGIRDAQRNTLEINRYGVCNTAAATAAKAVTVTQGTPSLVAGLHIFVMFANANTAVSPLLSVNNLSAGRILFNGEIISAGDERFLLKGMCEFVYDGSDFHLVGKSMPVWGTISNQ